MIRLNRKRKAARLLTFVLLAAMALSWAACGKKEQNNDNKETNKNTGEQKEFVWVPEFIEADTDNSFWNAKISGDYLYYMDWKWDEETETSSTMLSSISVLDGSAGPSISFAQEQGGETEEDGDKASDSNSNRNYSRFDLDKEGNVIVIEEVTNWSEDNYSQEYFLCKYNAQGEKQFEQDFSNRMDENSSWVRSFAVDEPGRAYVACESQILLFDAEGNFSGAVTMDSGVWMRGMGVGKDGKMYVAMDQQGSNKTVLREIDFEGKALGQTYNDFVSGNSDGGLAVGVEKDFMNYDSTGVYEYDMKTQTSELLFDWLDCDIEGSSVNLVHALEDGRIMTASYNYDSRKAELALISKKPASEVPEKITLVVGALTQDYAVRSAAVNFNKSSDRYHISIRSYFDYNDVTYNGDTNNYNEVRSEALTRMNNDITSDNCPDLLVIDGLDASKYVAKGVFEDLNAYFAKSTKVKRDDFFENILEAYTYDGVLVAVPRSFELTTVCGKASELGTEPGWTLEEMLAYADKHPDAELFGSYTKEWALQSMLQYNLSEFVDWESGKCSLDQADFVNILEFASRFPDEYKYDEDRPSLPKLIASGEVLLNREYIYDFESIQLADAIFDGDVCFIGYPNSSGESGTYFTMDSGLAITTKCSDKDGAWAFIESWLTSENDRYGLGFSSNKKTFAEARAEATKIEYLLDENGEKVLDENGEPIIQGGGGAVGYGDDWMYEYHVPTEEEVDKLEALIKIARPSTGSDSQIMDIISEEAQAFFKGQRTAQDVANNIQNRVQLYMNENM